MHLPKKDERYRRRGIKVEPKWLGMGECVIFRTLKLEFLSRTHYKECFHQYHILSGGRDLLLSHTAVNVNKIKNNK